MTEEDRKNLFFRPPGLGGKNLFRSDGLTWLFFFVEVVYPYGLL
jgi:hypothetical protein